MGALRGSPGQGAISRTTRQDDAMAGVRHGSALFYAADACCWWGPGGGLAVTRQEFWIPESFNFSVPSHTAVVSGGNIGNILSEYVRQVLTSNSWPAHDAAVREIAEAAEFD